jgi:hypothetical protein
LPRPGPFKLKSAPCMESGSTSFRRLVAGSFMEQTHRMAEISPEEISEVPATRSTIKRGI